VESERWPTPDELVEELHGLEADDDGAAVFRRLEALDPARFAAEIKPYLEGS
jgi:hypothetical protein